MTSKLIMAIAIAIVASGCTSLQTLPNGHMTTIAGPSLKARSGLAISSAPLVATPEYAAGIKCRYRETRKRLEDRSENIRYFELTINQVQDKKHVVIKYENGDTNSALIGKHGKLYDFNLINDITGERVDSQNYDESISDVRTNVKSEGDRIYKSASFVNPISVFLPEFSSELPISPGAVISQIKSDDGEIWGSYIFRGAAQFSGREVYVLDLERVGPAFSSPVLYGFTLIDKQTSLPTYNAFYAGTTNVDQLISCHP